MKIFPDGISTVVGKQGYQKNNRDGDAQEQE
jgi:hypothetical protein